jgi:hypothetical protein
MKDVREIGHPFFSSVAGGNAGRGEWSDRKPSFAVMVTRSASESALIFRITWPRCAFTVISLMPSSPPICLFIKPATTNAMTSRSRRLSDA